MSAVDGDPHTPDQAPADDASRPNAPGTPSAREPAEPAEPAGPEVREPTEPAGPEPAAAEAPDQALSGAPPATRRWASKKAVRLCLLLLLVAGAAVTWRTFDTTVYSPSKPVEQYLSALGRGDAATALAMVKDLDLSPAEQKTMADAVYGKASDRPTDVEVTEVDRDRGQASVAVRYTQGGAVITQEFAVTRTGSRNVMFSEWAIEHLEFARLSVGSTAPSAIRDRPSSALVNGVECPLVDDSSALLLLPGTYTISSPDAGAYVEANTFTVTVGGDAEPPRDVDHWLGYRLSDSGTKAAEDRARKWLDACQKSAPAVPEGCPFGMYAESLADFTWRTTEEPRFAVWADDSVVIVDVRGKAQLRGTQTKASRGWGFDDAGWFEEPHTLYVRTYFGLEGDALVEAEIDDTFPY